MERNSPLCHGGAVHRLLDAVDHHMGVVTVTAHTCQARRIGDQMQCGRCGKQWDVNDPELPQCDSAGEVAIRQMREMLERVKCDTHLKH